MDDACLELSPRRCQSDALRDSGAQRRQSGLKRTETRGALLFRSMNVRWTLLSCT